MLARTETMIRSAPAIAAALIVAVIGIATILGAWFFQYGLGLQPCALCLEQRVPYYVAIPLALLIVLAAQRGAPRAAVAGGLLIVALAMLWGTGLGAYHAGVEWHWWAGPTDCSGPVAGFGQASDLMKRLQNASVVRCDEAPWRFLGLSLAGYNVLISLALVTVALWGAVAALRRAPTTP
jgi:disulfide bond formation protein DsbB